MTGKITDLSKRAQRHTIFAALLITFILAGSGYAWAHRVTVFALVEGETVYTVSKFSGGKRVTNGNITVTDLQGNLLLEGKTDEEGEFSFKIPKRTALKIQLKAGMGHGAEWTIPAEEIEGAVPEHPENSPDPKPAETEKKDDASSVILKGVTREEIQKAVDIALDKRLKPIISSIEKLNEPGVSLRDILGGIGYILGLVGIGAYVQSRRKPEKT